jgi:hypothetical protein
LELEDKDFKITLFDKWKYLLEKTDNLDELMGNFDKHENYV